MDTLCLKAGIQGLVGPISVPCPGAPTNPSQVSASAAVGRSSPAASMSIEKKQQPSQRNSRWGFSFRYPLRSLLWSGGAGGKERYDNAIAADDAAVLMEEEKDEKFEEKDNGNWVMKILHVRSLRKEEDEVVGNGGGFEDSENGGVIDDDGESSSECGGGGDDEGCDVCSNLDDDDDEKIKFDRDSFSKLLRRVTLAEARLYAQLSYLGSLAYSIPKIKPENLLRIHGMRLVTSSFEKKEEARKAAEEKAAAEGKENKENEVSETQVKERNTTNPVEGDAKTVGNRISASAAYQIAASAASYLHSHTKSILPFKSSKSTPNKDSSETAIGNHNNIDATNKEVASLMATTDSVTSVVAAKEEVKQAVADDLSSTHSSPCEWFICDDDQSLTRFFVIQGSESLASWKANLLFEPIKFEGLDVIVHRGIYEAAKGMYQQMLPEVRAHLKSHGSRAKFRFTGHSLGGSLSLLVNLMLLIRGEVPLSSLLPVITFGSPSIMCGGDRLLRDLGLPRSHVQAIAMHRDIVPRAFSCNYPNRVAEFLKAVNGNFRDHPCLNNQKLLYAPMGEFLILQPDEKHSPNHHLLPSGSGLYLMSYPVANTTEGEKHMLAAQAVFLNSPHPLEILSDRSAYGSEGAIQRDHDMNSYLKSVRNVIRQELNVIRKARRENRRKVWWPLVAPSGVNAGGIVIRRHAASGNIGHAQFNFVGILQSGKESLKRFSTLVASQHMHLLVVLLFPARMLILGTYSVINFHS